MAEMNSREKDRAPNVRIGRTIVTPTDQESAITLILKRLGSGGIVVTPNIVQIHQAYKCEPLRKANEHAFLALPDGWPVAVLASHLASSIKLLRPRRVTGSDLSPLLLRRATDAGLKVALVGGGTGAGERVRALYRSDQPNTIFLEPVPRSEFDDPRQRAQLVARLVAASPHLIFIGLGVPKQEILALELEEAGSTSVILCVGAAIDFLAGTHQRAPLLVQQLGLEWAYRICREPRRLLGRYLRAAPFYLYLTVQEICGAGRRESQR